MSHFDASANSNYPWYVRLIFWAQRKKYGKTLAPSYYWGRSPALMLGLQIFYRFLDRPGNPLPRALRALVSLRVSQMNHCAFCFDLSSSFLEDNEETRARIEALAGFRESGLFTEKEKASLAYAESVSGSAPASSEPALTGLAEHFSKKEIVELTAWIVFQNMSSRFNAALDIEPQGFCLRG